jgi:hypothetical protein
LDTVIVIYAVEGNPARQQRALNHLAALEQAGHRYGHHGRGAAVTEAASPSQPLHLIGAATRVSRDT